MKILITGITGFIGRHLSKVLYNRGYEVYGLARYVSDRDLYDLKDINIYYGDILDQFFLIGVFEKINPDIIIHLATQSSVEYSFNNPYEEYQVGFIGTTNVSHIAMKKLPKLKKFIFASSVEVYGNQYHFPIKENTSPRPASPYGVTKVAAEYHMRYLYEGHGFPCIILRSTNTYGRKYNHHFVIEHTVYEMLTKKNGEIFMGDSEPIRDFLYVDDEVNTYIKIIETEKDIFGEIFNTGTCRGISIKELVEIIGKFIGFNGIVNWNKISKRPYEIKKLIISYDKLRKYLGWTPKYTLEEGLRKTIEWWRDYIDEINKG